MLVNKITKKWLQAFIKDPKSSIILSSYSTESGIKIANYIYKSLIKTKGSPLMIISSYENKSIGIDDIRNLRSSLNLKANSTNDTISRIACIANAEALTVEAQNALLKLLEELPDKTLVILIKASGKELLSTIKSRCYNIDILAIEKDVAVLYGQSKGYTKQDTVKAYALSEGDPSMFVKYLNSELDSIGPTDTAKEFLRMSVFDRQSVLKDISKSKQDSAELTKSLSLIARSGMENSSSLTTKKRWRNILKNTNKASELLNKNVPVKLVMLSLSVDID